MEKKGKSICLLRFEIRRARKHLPQVLHQTASLRVFGAEVLQERIFPSSSMAFSRAVDLA